jgi:hypothetical protein
MPYESTPKDLSRAYIIGAIYVALIVLLGVMLFKIWPPIPWPDAEARTNGLKQQLIAAAQCSETTPTASPSPSPSATPANNQAAGGTGANNAAGSVAQPAGGTQSTNAAPGQTGGQNSTGAQGNGRASAAPAGNTGGATSSNQPPSGGAAPATSEKPSPSPTPDVSGEIIILPMKLFGGACVQTTFDERLLLLVIVAGMLGAFVHGATSLADYIGNNGFNRSWTWFYVLRPGIGMALALVFYFVIRGGFLSTTGGAHDINPYGIAALAGMVGMFSKQATDKLSEVFSTLFRSAGDAQRKDPLKATTGASLQLDPKSVVAGGEAFTLAVSGTGFVEGAVVNVNDVAQTTKFESATKLTAEIAKETIANPGTLKVAVVNKDQTRIGPVDLTVTSSDGAPPPGGTPPPGATPPPPGTQGGSEGGAVNNPATVDASAVEEPVDGEGGDDDSIDGCDVDMKADTPDEDLPITKGGMR